MKKASCAKAKRTQQLNRKTSSKDGIKATHSHTSDFFDDVLEVLIVLVFVASLLLLLIYLPGIDTVFFVMGVIFIVFICCKGLSAFFEQIMG